KIDKQFARDLQKPGKEVLKVEGFTSKGVFSNINFSVREREIVGFSGLVGSGRTEVMRAVFGIDKFDSGSLHFYGNKVEKSDPLKSVKLKLAFIPEDRKSEGTCLNLNIRDNIILASMASIFKSGIINLHEEKKLVTQAIKDLDIKTPSMQQKVKFLSGGNQQKVVLAKWLLTKSKIFIFDEPTRGIDVGAKAEFHKLINLLVKEGAGVIMISSEMPEVIGMSDRIFVMKEGTIVQEFSREEASQEKILKAAIG
ncbi:MAG: ATP-binding cassette domain-containing protein, partial [Bacilli bacterium]